jgi:carboxymethylenebutenolidase
MNRHRLLLLLFLSATALVLSTVPARPRALVSSQAVEYPGSEGEMPATLYVPDGATALPAVLVLHTLAGPGPNVEAFARDLAAAGYVTLTPDVFSLHDFGPDGRTDHPLILKDAEGALKYLTARPRVDPARVGAVGFSFGGRLAVIAGALFPDRIKAIAVYYAIASHAELGGPLTGSAARARPLSERVGAIRAPVIIHHGEVDANVPVSQATLLHRGLLAAGKSSTLHLYPGADHLFNFSIGPDVHYDAAAARLSWERTLAFLDRHLRGR